MSAEELRENAVVSYTVKEILDEQTGLLRTIDSKVDTKADKADLIPLLSRLDNHHERIVVLEDERKSDRTAQAVKSRFRRNVWLAVSAVCVPLATALIIVFVH